jgi:hypothetical protein
MRAVVVALVALVFTASPVEARTGKDGPGEVRVAGVCATGAAARLRLRTGEDGIEVRFGVDQSRTGDVWRLALVHESRVVWKGAARTTRGNRSVELRWTLPDLSGTDTVTARAWGPRGLTCRATATLAEA